MALLLSHLQYMWNPLSWAMEAAAIIAIALLDYADFALILALLLVRTAHCWFAAWAGADVGAAHSGAADGHECHVCVVQCHCPAGERHHFVRGGGQRRQGHQGPDLGWVLCPLVNVFGTPAAHDAFGASRGWLVLSCQQGLHGPGLGWLHGAQIAHAGGPPPRLCGCALQCWPASNSMMRAEHSPASCPLLTVHWPCPALPQPWRPRPKCFEMGRCPQLKLPTWCLVSRRCAAGRSHQLQLPNPAAPVLRMCLQLWCGTASAAAQRAARRVSLALSSLQLSVPDCAVCFGQLSVTHCLLWLPPTGDIVIIRLGDIVPADIKILAEEGGSGRPEDETPLQVGFSTVCVYCVVLFCCGMCCSRRTLRPLVWDAPGANKGGSGHPADAAALQDCSARRQAHGGQQPVHICVV